MRVLRIREPGGPEVLELTERPTPDPGPEEVRVRVRAIGVNRADLLQRRGLYPAPAGPAATSVEIADVPGLEFAGEVDAVGSRVRTLERGARVYGIVPGGAYAEHVVTHELAVAPIPDGLSDVEAGAVPEAFLTAFDALISQANLRPGERVLIHAVGSGVGLAALQLCVAMGAEVMGTSRTDDKLRRAQALGLARGIHVQNAAFSTQVLEASGGHGVDVVLDLVGAAYLQENLASAAPRARLVMVGLVAGARAELDLGTLLRKRLTLHGTVLRSRSLDERIALHGLLRRNLGALLMSHRIRPVVDRTYPLERAADAHRYLENNESFGKVVLTA
jgi:putative PIG3 family NAD(P)H quinone oxidoreductase